MNLYVRLRTFLASNIPSRALVPETRVYTSIFSEFPENFVKFGAIFSDFGVTAFFSHADSYVIGDPDCTAEFLISGRFAFSNRYGTTKRCISSPVFAAR